MSNGPKAKSYLLSAEKQFCLPAASLDHQLQPSCNLFIQPLPRLYHLVPLPLLRAVYALPPDPNPMPFRCVFSDGFRESAMYETSHRKHDAWSNR
jgi:hypothetical protein